MDGICVYCGKPIKWKGKLWVCCEHCRRYQIWETSGKTTYEIWKEKKDGNDL